MNLFGIDIPGFDALLQAVALKKGIADLNSLTADKKAVPGSTAATVVEASTDASANQSITTPDVEIIDA